MANFEAFLWSIKLSENLLFLKSDHVVFHKKLAQKLYIPEGNGDSWMKYKALAANEE